MNIIIIIIFLFVFCAIQIVVYLKNEELVYRQLYLNIVRTQLNWTIQFKLWLNYIRTKSEIVFPNWKEKREEKKWKVSPKCANIFSNNKIRFK